MESIKYAVVKFSFFVLLLLEKSSQSFTIKGKIRPNQTVSHRYIPKFMEFDLNYNHKNFQFSIYYNEYSIKFY